MYPHLYRLKYQRMNPVHSCSPRKHCPLHPHPDFFGDVKKADEALSSQPSQLYLRFYYTAAVLLQRKYKERLIKIFGEQLQLPDLFSRLLGVSLDSNPNDALVRLAQRHQVLSGQRINWLETYEHGAERLVKYMEKFK